ncbi:MAG TPA: methylated-DNA--[protein]-cysteine S-methyltransferase [Myxococcales bacterium]|jgi:methylated-DNA-[protein]-cysteine S-methyltransferase
MLFETRAGPLRLRWSERGLTAIEMPELTGREVRAQLLRQKAEPAPPPFVKEAAAALKQHLNGSPRDLSQLTLDLSVLTPFQAKVYEAARSLPSGRTATYGEIAAKLGKPGASRAVGQALGKNPFLIAVPCHRVLGAGGSAGGFSAPGGVIAKQRLLALEGVRIAVDHGLDYDPVAAVDHLKAKDKKLARYIDKVGPFRGRPAGISGTPFQSLAESIVYQQLTGKAAATILARVVALFHPRRFPEPQDVLEMADEKLRSAGLSRAKTLALKDLAQKTLDGVVPPTVAELESLSDQEIVDRLTEVRGIGPWTVEMMLIFRLARPDVLPVTDYGVRKGFALVQKSKELPSPAALLEYGERWRPFRSVASWYLWRVLDL